MSLNLPGTILFLRALLSPSSLIPHASIPDFNALSAPTPSLLPTLSRPPPSSSLPSTSSSSPAAQELPLASASPSRSPSALPKISGIVLDKDNCFTLPHSLSIFPAYRSTFASLARRYPGRVLIVSNTIGTPGYPSTSSSFREFSAALDEVVQTPSSEVSEKEKVCILEHAHKKPSSHCAVEVLAWFAARGVPREEIVVVGDRLATDTLLAKRMGCWSVYIENGPAQGGVFARLEKGLLGVMRRVGWRATLPLPERGKGRMSEVR